MMIGRTDLGCFREWVPCIYIASRPEIVTVENQALPNGQQAKSDEIQIKKLGNVHVEVVSFHINGRAIQAVYARFRRPPPPIRLHPLTSMMSDVNSMSVIGWMASLVAELQLAQFHSVKISQGKKN